MHQNHGVVYLHHSRDAYCRRLHDVVEGRVKVTESNRMPQLVRKRFCLRTTCSSWYLVIRPYADASHIHALMLDVGMTSTCWHLANRQAWDHFVNHVSRDFGDKATPFL